jgi:hypothetical protein
MNHKHLPQGTATPRAFGLLKTILAPFSTLPRQVFGPDHRFSLAKGAT